MRNRTTHDSIRETIVGALIEHGHEWQPKRVAFDTCADEREAHRRWLEAMPRDRAIEIADQMIWWFGVALEVLQDIDSDTRIDDLIEALIWPDGKPEATEDAIGVADGDTPF
ncbi:MAG: hypothetical protein LCH61_19120 [Proteobacteria bacterium]|nr:hypothetical protein [Pseudomonadota bacterium]